MEATMEMAGLIVLGGGLLIIIFAVIAAVAASVVSAVAAVNADVNFDEE